MRAERFDKTLDSFNEEQGNKVARTIAKYHQMFVAPRLEYLEAWWYQKLWSQARRLFRWVFRVKPPAPDVPAEEPPENISYEEMQEAMEGFEAEAARPKV